MDPQYMLRLTRAQVREIDRRAIEQYHIPGIVLMENAARNAAEVAWEMLKRRSGTHVILFCGGGNNGGDGFAIARHLHNRGVNVEIVPVFEASKLTGDALANWQIVQSMELDLVSLDDAAVAIESAPDLIIDALLGTGASGEPRDDVRRAIEMLANQSPVLAIDVPSGLDCDSGEAGTACVRASVTVTFVAEKVGFANPKAREQLGEVIVAGIGCPRELVERVALT